MLSPISLGSSFVLSNTAVTTSAPSVSASTSFREPPYRPTGVRTGLQMTASLILFLLIAMRPLGRISSEHGSARLGHRPDLLLRVAGRRQERRAVLAQARGGRGRIRLRFRPVGGGSHDVQPSLRWVVLERQEAGERQLRVGEEVCGRVHRRVRNVSLLEKLAPLGRGPRAHRLRHPGVHLVDGGGAVRVGAEAGVALHTFWVARGGEEAAPLLVVVDEDAQVVILGAVGFPIRLQKSRVSWLAQGRNEGEAA